MLRLVGTIAVLLKNANPKRTKFRVTMQPTSIDAGNTGRVHLGFGFQPTATVGHASQGFILIAATILEEPVGERVIEAYFKQSVWAIASAADQSVIVEEYTEEAPKP